MNPAFHEFLEAKRTGKELHFSNENRKVVFKNSNGWRIYENYDVRGNIDFYEVNTPKDMTVQVYADLEIAKKDLKESVYSCASCGSKDNLEIDNIQLKCNSCREEEKRENLERLMGEE